ncbi:MAG: hypothetical protein EZS28_051234, partial [Streblomastix strix]
MELHWEEKISRIKNGTDKETFKLKEQWEMNQGIFCYSTLSTSLDDHINEDENDFGINDNDNDNSQQQDQSNKNDNYKANNIESQQSNQYPYEVDEDEDRQSNDAIEAMIMTKETLTLFSSTMQRLQFNTSPVDD